MDMREMEPTAQVSNKPRYQTMFLQLKKKLTVKPVDVNLAASDKKRSIVSVKVIGWTDAGTRLAKLQGALQVNIIPKLLAYW